MKKIYKIIILIILLVSALFINNSVKAMLPLSGKMIIVDVGHGGKDPGSVKNNIYEKNINLSISKYLELELVKVGADVILTRDGDYDLSYPNAKWRKKSDFDNRIKIINESNANMYISIHLNYLTDSKYYGPQVFYYGEANKKIAEIFQMTLNKELNTNREIKPISKSTYMYNKLKIPGVLVECGFLSNPKEFNNLQNSSYQQKLAIAIKNATIDYY